MALPKDTIWSIDAHTRAKHEILRRYLQAWFPILGTYHGRVIYVDGFSGPGRYKGGELGSPLIALQVAMEHRARLTGEVIFLFVDKDKDRIDHLKSELAKLSLPLNFKVHAEEGRFDEVFSELLRSVREDKRKLAPSFVFIDPFGFAGAPFDLVKQILENPRSEVFITFMVNAVQRFLEHPDNAIRKHFVELFGSDEVLKITGGGEDRVEALRKLYQRQLESCATFVRSFEVRDHPERVLYYLFFASNHPLGHEKMKEAMWRADPTGGFRFRDNTDTGQLVLLDPDVDLAEQVCKMIVTKFGGQTIRAEEVKEYVLNETAFLDKHKTAALRLIEGRDLLTVEPRQPPAKKRRKDTFPDDVVLRFK